jgi:uncharacterized membrane protein (UPF0127 family)
MSSIITRKLEFSRLFFALVLCVISLFIFAISLIGFLFEKSFTQILNYNADATVIRSTPYHTNKMYSQYSIEYATTSAEQERGLSYRARLATSTVMVFAFDHQDLWQIWMKDMHFPLDIVWLDKDLKVIYIKNNALPESYPDVFMPPQLASYVIEANVGFIDQNSLKIDDRFTIIKKNDQHDIIFKTINI